jgi:hypothetical protein
MAETDQRPDRVWPPLYRMGHRVEHALDLTTLDCVAEVVADCKDCPPAAGRHKTCLSAVDLRTLREKYGPDWAIGYYIDKGWNVEVGICEDCLRLRDETAGRRN